MRKVVARTLTFSYFLKHRKLKDGDEAPLNLTRRLGEDFVRANSGLLARTYLYFPVPRRFLDFNSQQMPNGQMIQGVKLPRVISGDFFGHGMGMINSYMDLRSCVLLHGDRGCVCKSYFSKDLVANFQITSIMVCYVALRLEVSRLENGVFDGSLRFWNRRYAGFMLHSARNIGLSDLELSTSRVYFLGSMKQSYISTLLF